MAVKLEKPRAFEADTKAQLFSLMASQFDFVKQNVNGAERICLSKLHCFKHG